MAMIGTVTLNPSIDQHWFVDDLLKDDTNRARTILETPGGKGLNVSKVIRELGGKTTAYALLGGYAGGHLLSLAKKLDFPVIDLPIEGTTRSNIVVSDIKDDTHTRISAPGPFVGPSELRRLMKTLLSVRVKPSFWAFGGSLPPGLKVATYRDMIHRLQKKGVPCVLDTDGDALRLGLEAKPFMIKPNEHEMERLCGRDLESIPDFLEQARRLVRGGIRLVVVSLGARGALFVRQGEAFRITTPRVTVRSKIGAGDSLIGGLLLGLERGWSLERSAHWGVAASTSAVMREAPRLCRKGDIRPMVGRLRLERL